MTDYFTCKCPVCGEGKGRHRDHSKCSKILKARYEAENAALVGYKSITVAQAKKAQKNARAKRYDVEKARWPD